MPSLDQQLEELGSVVQGHEVSILRLKRVANQSEIVERFWGFVQCECFVPPSCQSVAFHVQPVATNFSMCDSNCQNSLCSHILEQRSVHAVMLFDKQFVDNKRIVAQKLMFRANSVMIPFLRLR